MTNCSINFGFPDDAIDTGFYIGTVVTLVTGSPDMVVTDVCDDCGDVGVCWYDDHGGMQVAVLPTEALVYAE